MMTVVPAPGRDWISRPPWCSSRKRRAMTRPSPVPRSLEENSSLAMRSSSSALIPTPLSRMRTSDHRRPAWRQGHLDLAVPAGHGLQGVGQHVVDHLLDLLAVGDDVDRRSPASAHREPHLGIDRPQVGDRLVDQVVEPEGLGLQFIQLRQVQETESHPPQVLGLLDDVADGVGDHRLGDRRPCPAASAGSVRPTAGSGSAGFLTSWATRRPSSTRVFILAISETFFFCSWMPSSMELKPWYKLAQFAFGRDVRPAAAGCPAALRPCRGSGGGSAPGSCCGKKTPPPCR